MGHIDLFGFLPFSWLDLLDIVLFAVLMFKIYEWIKGTTAIRIFLGIISIYLFWRIVTALQMELMSEVLKQFINVGVIAIIIVFQQEIRRFLLVIGNSSFFRNIGAKGGLWSWLGKSVGDAVPSGAALTEAVFRMSSQRVGALIVMEGTTRLTGIIATGKSLNAEVSSWLIESIFFKNSPLHDGATVIRGNKIVAASCTLPLTLQRDLPSSFGMRHRAGIGVSEEFDVTVIVVSEESGKVSIIRDGVVFPCDDREIFRSKLAQQVNR